MRISESLSSDRLPRVALHQVIGSISNPFNIRDRSAYRFCNKAKTDLLTCSKTSYLIRGTFKVHRKCLSLCPTLALMSQNLQLLEPLRVEFHLGCRFYFLRDLERRIKVI